MAWEPLSKRLEQLPHVLAGPVLRKVTPKTVTVWVALRKAAKVSLSVQDDKQTTIMEGSRNTISIGKNLHLVAVTAEKLPVFLDATEGVVYEYDLKFDFDGKLMTLNQATANAKLSYMPSGKPSFALPPKDPNLLRLLQGSCRMPHADGKDTFPIVDDLIAATATNAFARPHQLLLTGDQIYADDVADTLLLMLTDAGDTLLGWNEVIPPDNLLPAQLPPYWREKPLSDAGFTSVDLRSHLLSLGEYLSMYLFVWSDVLWPATSGLPTIDELFDKVQFGGFPDSDPRHRANVEKVRKTAASRRKTIVGDILAILQFRIALPQVRRALANIPSYMIFDDHEVTDDWNMTRSFCRDFYGKLLGQRVARNALLAYALCQHWGNAPEQFAAVTPAPPGLDLLRLLDTANPTQANAFDQKAASLERQSTSLTSLLGLHDDAALSRKPHALFHDAHSLNYHYTVEGPAHQVIFTDTRTWRSFPNGGNESSEIFPEKQFKEQILNTPATGDRVLLVVLSTNAPPVEPIRAAARHAGIAKTFAHHPDVYEAWEIISNPFDRLLKALTDKLPLNSNGRRVGQAILLSGDVHHSFASRLIYRATNRFEDKTAQPATAVIAQLVASSFKKETGDTRGFHREGYTFAPAAAKFLGLIRRHEPQGYLGWNLSSKTQVGIIKVKQFKMGHDSPQVLEVDVPLEVSGSRTIEVRPMIIDPLGASTTFFDLKLTVAPHYRYRLDYLVPTGTQIQLNAPPMPAMPAGATPAQRKQAAEAFHAAVAKYRIYNHAAHQPKVVGVNNFGEITFIWPPSPVKFVNHTLHWWDSALSKVVTTYPVSLNPDDPIFPDLKAKVEP
jgi:hypothetical protein